ncbi:hypothetical protein AB8S08_02290 [Pseudidiomarina sp. PP-1MA]|uniref:Uncharacterized protein n=1 Tax=Pseudidiomarina sp. PP-1MA TaxID=3237706 RepID=A0AB39XB96_9GAMM
MKPSLRILPPLAVTAATLFLAACGGNSSPDIPTPPPPPPPPPPVTYSLSGTVSGLAGDLVISANTEELSVTENGDITFVTEFSSGDEVDVAIVSQPPTQTCEITSAASFTFSDADIDDLTIVCTTLETLTIRGQIFDPVGTDANLTVMPYSDSVVSSSIDGNGYYELVLSTASSASAVEADSETALQLLVQGQDDWAPVVLSSRLVGLSHLVELAGSDRVLDASELAQVNIGAFTTARDAQIQILSRDMPINASTLALIQQEQDIWLQLEMAAMVQLLIADFLEDLAAADLTTLEILLNVDLYTSLLGDLDGDELAARVQLLIEDPSYLGDANWANLEGEYIELEPTAFYLPQTGDADNRLKLYLEAGQVALTGFMKEGFTPVAIEEDGRVLALPDDEPAYSIYLDVDLEQFGLSAEEISAYQEEFGSNSVDLLTIFEHDFRLLSTDESSITVLNSFRHSTKEKRVASTLLERDIVFPPVVLSNQKNPLVFANMATLREQAPVFAISSMNQLLIPLAQISTNEGIGIANLGTLQEVTLHENGRATMGEVEFSWSLSADQRELTLLLPYTTPSAVPATLEAKLFWRKFDDYAQDMIAEFNFDSYGTPKQQHILSRAAVLPGENVSSDVLLSTSETSVINYMLGTHQNLWDANKGMVYSNLLRVPNDNAPADGYLFSSDNVAITHRLTCENFISAHELEQTVAKCLDDQYIWQPLAPTTPWQRAGTAIFVGGATCNPNTEVCPGRYYQVLDSLEDLGVHTVLQSSKYLVESAGVPSYIETSYQLQTLIGVSPDPVVNPIEPTEPMKFEAPLQNYPRVLQ